MTFTRSYWPDVGAGWYGCDTPEKGDIITGQDVENLRAGRPQFHLFHQDCFKQKSCKSCDIWDHKPNCEPVPCQYDADTLVHVLDVKKRDPAHIMLHIMINGKVRTVLGLLQGRYQ